jgi:hypothetical protein
MVTILTVNSCFVGSIRYSTLLFVQGSLVRSHNSSLKFTVGMMMKATAATLLLFGLTDFTSTVAFQSPTAPLRVSFQKTRTLSALPPTESISDLITNLNYHYLDALSQQQLVLADAVADASQQQDTGWWASYLNIFKTCLLFVHNTIDQPLRSVGITQTWGPAIAIFTACKCRFVP